MSGMLIIARMVFGRGRSRACPLLFDYIFNENIIKQCDRKVRPYTTVANLRSLSSRRRIEMAIVHISLLFSAVYIIIVHE